MNFVELDIIPARLYFGKTVKTKIDKQLYTGAVLHIFQHLA